MWGYVQRSVDECMPVSLLDLQLAVEKCCIEVPPRQLRRRLAVLQLRKHSSTCSRAAWPAALRPRRARVAARGDAHIPDVEWASSEGAQGGGDGYDEE